MIFRFGVALAPDGGALKKMLLPFKLGVGGPLGSGQQWMSWIDRDDAVRFVEWGIENQSARGVYNATAPVFRDVVFGTAPFRARGLRVDTATGGSQLVALDDVRNVGPDAIVTDDATTALRSGPDMTREQLRDLTELSRLKVVDESGALLGQIERIDVDLPTGVVSGLEVHRGGVLGVGGENFTLGVDQVLSVGDELLTVRKAA